MKRHKPWFLKVLQRCPHFSVYLLVVGSNRWVLCNDHRMCLSHVGVLKLICHMWSWFWLAGGLPQPFGFHLFRLITSFWGFIPWIALPNMDDGRKGIDPSSRAEKSVTRLGTIVNDMVPWNGISCGEFGLADNETVAMCRIKQMTTATRANKCFKLIYHQRVIN